MNSFLYEKFIFAHQYRLWRHIAYWGCCLVLWPAFFKLIYPESSFWQSMVINFAYLPAAVLFSYPLTYFAIPYLLLKGKFFRFIFACLAWAAVGFLIIYFVKFYIDIPLQKAMIPGFVTGSGMPTENYFILTTSSAGFVVARFFKLWAIKSRDLQRAQQEKLSAELELLKAQLHPHFLFNTLNNIYAFALERSVKTPQLVLKLSTLLSYMLYECKTDEVMLEKEVEVMKNYIGLEKERYGDKLDISINIEGDIQHQFIAPLLILPFLENAFKHGASEQLATPWMSIDLSVKDQILKCKVVNSKNETVPFHQHGVGINNVRKRLQFLYPDRHQLKLSDEGAFFVVALMVKLKPLTPKTHIATRFFKYAPEKTTS